MGFVHGFGNTQEPKTLKPCRTFKVLGGSWVTIVITHIKGIITQLRTTHGPPSTLTVRNLRPLISQPRSLPSPPE